MPCLGYRLKAKWDTARKNRRDGADGMIYERPRLGDAASEPSPTPPTPPTPRVLRRTQTKRTVVRVLTPSPSSSTCNPTWSTARSSTDSDCSADSCYFSSDCDSCGPSPASSDCEDDDFDPTPPRTVPCSPLGDVSVRESRSNLSNMGPTVQGSPKAGKLPTAARRRGWELFRRGRRERAQHSANTAQAASTSVPFEDAFRLDGKVLGTGINGPVLSAIGRDSRRYAVKAVALGEDESSEEVEIQRDCAGPHVVPIVAEYRVSTARWVSISGERPPPGASAERGVRLLVLPQYASDSFDRWEEDGMALPEDEVKRVAVQLATAVSRLHSRGITHRDIKPENILLESSPGERWSVALADFGMATRDSAPRGGHNCTLVYAAPELVHRFVTGSDAPYTPEVDEWAVGVVIFLLLCGTWPFSYSAVCEDPDKTSLFYNELRTSPSSIRSGGRQGKWDSLSTAGQDAITRLLDPNPSLRLTADELLAHPWLSDSEL